jgi:hypothetical protein
MEQEKGSTQQRLHITGHTYTMSTAVCFYHPGKQKMNYSSEF